MILDDDTVINLEVVEAVHHPVQAETMLESVPNVRSVRLSCDHDHSLQLVFDREARPGRLPRQRFNTKGA
jgi:hypothetical protein